MKEKHTHVHLHFEGASLCEFLSLLRSMLDSQTRIEGKVDKIMAASDEIKSLCKEIDDATDAVAVVLTDLRDKIKTSMTQVEVDAIKTELTARVEELKGLAKNPDEPVPE
jgi:predicted transcriptional regulator